MPDDALFSGTGPVAEVMAAHDWSASAVGPPSSWSPMLRQVVQLMLASRFSMWMGWGPDLAVFYNDAYRRDTLQSKHPWALGRPAHEVWSEIWDDIGPRIGSVLATGRATWDEGLMLFLDRAGYHEETYHTFSYSPLRDDAGDVAGFLCVVSEDTERVLGERRLRVLRELGDISAVTAPTDEQACSAALEVLSNHRLDIPFASIYLLDAAEATAVRAGFYGMVDDPAVVPLQLSADRDLDFPIWAALSAGKPIKRDGLDGQHPGLFKAMPEPMHDRPPASMLAVPLAGGGAGGPVGVLFAGISPYRAIDEDYQQFIELVAGQVANSVADARAYQAQRRRAEELAELDRAKTEFFTGVSHELRTPLTLISGPAEDGLTDLDAPLPPAQRARMEMIARNGGRLRRLVDTLLEFVRLEAGRAVPRRVAVDLSALTRGIAESFAPAVLRAGLRFVIDCPRLDSAVSVDVDMWEKIVLNLLSNAVKYTLDGEVRISLRPTAEGGVQLAVTDTGIGIPADDLPRLFERFHRVRGARGRSHEGSGIGLALVNELAALHDGGAAVDSTLGDGSRFTVTLPPDARSMAAPVSPPEPAAVGLYREEALQWSSPGELWVDRDERAEMDRGDVIPAAPDGAASVLVAEDNPDLRRFLSQLLSPHYIVTAVPDGAAALRAARARRPDLVLTDVMMPGTDGFELIAALRADSTTTTIPVIMLSARAGEEAAIEGLAAGADDYLVKPFSSHDLLARVRSNLAMARLRNREGAWRTALVNALQDGLYVLDADGSVIEINQSFTDIMGYGPEQLPYPAPHPWWPDPHLDPYDYATVMKAVHAIQSSGTGRFVLPMRHHDGHRLWVSCSVSTIADQSGNGPVIVGVLRDVTAERRAAVRDRLLAEIGDLLARPDEVDRLAAFTRLAASELADLVVISLLQADGTLRPAAAAHRSRPETAAEVLRLPSHRIPASLSAHYLTSKAIALDDMEDLIDEVSVDTADVPALRAVGARSGLVVPLTAGGRLLGSLIFASTEQARNDDGIDLPTVEELARRLATAIDADRLITREHHLHSVATDLASAATVTEVASILAAGLAGVFDADAVMVHVAAPDDPGTLRLVHTRGEPAESDAVPTTSIAADLPACRAARDRTPLWLGDQVTAPDGHPRAVAALPLMAGSALVGALTMTFHTARAFLPDERSLAMTLAGQAALALDRAAISDAQGEIAQTLQLGLLPARLPALPEVALSARYLPAGVHTSAGGDWYDVALLDEHHVAITVGDVVGHGAAAAAVMGQLRAALSAYLMVSNSPAHALQLLSRFAEHVDGARGSSAICLVLDTATGYLRWARAGHVPPLVLLPDGTTHYLDDADGAILGLSGTPPITEGAVEMNAGTTVLLFTDGLVERRSEDLDEGLGRLAAAITPYTRAPVGQLLTSVLDAALDGTDHPDDVAAVVARIRPAPLERTRPALPSELSAVRREIDTWAAMAALPADQADDLQLALGEALSNSVEHAYADGGQPAPTDVMSYRVTMASDDSVAVETADSGTWRPPLADPGYRGFGLRTIAALTDELHVGHGDTGTRLRFTVPPPASTVITPSTEPARDRARAHTPQAGLEITKDENGLLLTLSGELDLATVPAIRESLLQESAAAPGPVEIDVRDVGFLASAGVALLIDALAGPADRPRLRCVPQGPVAKILRLTGLIS